MTTTKKEIVKRIMEVMGVDEEVLQYCKKELEKLNAPRKPSKKDLEKQALNEEKAGKFIEYLKTQAEPVTMNTLKNEVEEFKDLASQKIVAIVKVAETMAKIEKSKIKGAVAYKIIQD